MAKTVNQRGFSLLEGLVALLVVSFGMLVLVGMQMTLTRNSEVARQRSEAMRLAEEKLEQLRGFKQIASVTGGDASNFGWDSIPASGSESITAGDAGSNTAYTRTWGVSGTSADSARVISVSVSWVDRAGSGATSTDAKNIVTLNSAIAKVDPRYSAGLNFPQIGNGIIKRPKNRNLNIPIAAIDLGNGHSSIRVNQTWTAVFSNATGWVIRYCDRAVTTAADESNCPERSAYIVAGYVSGEIGSVTAVNLSSLTGQSSRGAEDCGLDVARDQNSGSTIAGYKYYICVIEVPNQRDVWGGTIRLAGSVLGSGANAYLVCRFQYPENSTSVGTVQSGGLTPNQRNVQPYSGVNDSLDQQNYVITTASSCPTLGGLATTEHQNCRRSNPNRAANTDVTSTEWRTNCPSAGD